MRLCPLTRTIIRAPTPTALLIATIVSEAFTIFLLLRIANLLRAILQALQHPFCGGLRLSAATAAFIRRGRIDDGRA